MTSYTDVFSDSLVPGAEVSFASYTLTANAQFQWPYNYSGTDKTLASSNEISCSAGMVMTMPAASEVSNGETVIIKNSGSETLTIVKSDASALTTVAAGVSVYLQVKDNTDEGTWSVTTFGTGTSAADAATLAGYGVKAIGSVLNAAYQSETQSDSWSIDQYDRAKVFVFTGGTATCSLDPVSTFGTDFFCMIRNSGTGSLTIDPSTTELIDGGVTLTLNPGESLVLVSTGTAWYSIGYGRSMIYQFTQLVYTAAAGSQTLTSTEASNKLLTFIGSPASAATVVVPSVVSIYYVHNDLSTAQNVTIETAAGLGAVIPQGQRAIVFCDGTDVLAAQTAEITGDVSMTDGTYSAPSLAFTSQTNTGLYKSGTYGIGFSVNGTALGKFDENGFEVTTGYLKLPAATSPSQIAEGALVWDNDSDLLTVGDGSGRKTMLDTSAAATIYAPIASPTFTGTVGGITKSMVGLGNVDNTSDVNKPVSTATQTALNLKVTASAPSISGTLDCNNNNIQEIKVATFNTPPTLATTTGTVNIDWSAAQNYYQNEPTGDITYTFTAPPGRCHLQLYIHSDGTTTARTFTWPGTVIWLGYEWEHAANKKAIINFWYDGTNYFAQGASQV
mgnify:FL=1